MLYLFQVQDLGLSVSYIENERVRRFAWHLLSFPHIPLQYHAEAEQIVQSEVDSFLEEVNIDNKTFS